MIRGAFVLKAANYSPVSSLSADKVSNLRSKYLES